MHNRNLYNRVYTKLYQVKFYIIDANKTLLELLYLCTNTEALSGNEFLD